MSFRFIRWCVCYKNVEGNISDDQREEILSSSTSEKHRIRIYKLRGAGKKFKILLLNHQDDEVQRELVIAGLGGDPFPCVSEALKSKEFKRGATIVGRKYPADGNE